MTQTEQPATPAYPQPSAETTAKTQAAAFAQFRAWATDPRALVLDTETTGLKGQAWEIAAGRPGHTRILLDVRGEPETPWTEGALAMQAPDIREQLRGLPHLRTHVAEVLELLTLNTPLAYVEAFDRPVIERTFDLRGLPEFGCVALAYASLFPTPRWSTSRGFWKTVKLAEACEAEGIDTTQVRAHSAAGDAWLAGQLILAVARRAPA
ncbi:hypothetical protein [Deinococcus multiflagellatus]|uniref:3'-5' exonuclease n=1 Tax=Deinococcus multiflagellatus TaxID=1656887 RepID=A0ABW1ZQG1_9DEIO|nr:hypothetical protein [Deinococcus multiflagellatus]MBZ9715834.1 hypothetical protein [Deinococcus multiflagellatus]